MYFIEEFYPLESRCVYLFIPSFISHTNSYYAFVTCAPVRSSLTHYRPHLSSLFLGEGVLNKVLYGDSPCLHLLWSNPLPFYIHVLVTFNEKGMNNYTTSILYPDTCNEKGKAEK